VPAMAKREAFWVSAGESDVLGEPRGLKRGVLFVKVLPRGGNWVILFVVCESNRK